MVIYLWTKVSPIGCNNLTKEDIYVERDWKKATGKINISNTISKVV